MKRAVIYARVSTDRQAEEGLSIDSQIESCRRKADDLNAAVLHVFRDEGISGTTDARPGFRTAINRCAMGDVDYFICWSSSRFARDQADAIAYKRELQGYGTKMVYAQSSIDLDSHEGWMLDSFQQVIDESYSRQVSADTKRSMMKAAGEGYFMGGRLPFGYQTEQEPGTQRRRLVPLEHEALVVRMIFDWAAQGVGAKLIAERLNGQGQMIRGRRWHKGTVLHMLNSEVYMGTVVYNRFDRKRRKPRPEADWVRVHSHEALVSPEQWRSVQDGMSDRAPVAERSAPNSNHIFTGLLRCGLCNSSLQIATGTGRGGKVYSYFACRGYLQGCSCDFKRMRAEPFEQWLLQELLDKLLNRQMIEAVLRQLDDAAARFVKERATRRTSLVLELRAVEGRRNRLYEVLEEGGKDAPGVNELGPRLRKLNEQARQLEQALSALECEPEPTMGPLDVSADEAAEILRETVSGCQDPKTLRAFVASIVQMIVVKGEEVAVHYKPECLVLSDGHSVHSKPKWLPVPSKLRTEVLTISRRAVPVLGDPQMRLVA